MVVTLNTPSWTNIPTCYKIDSNHKTCKQKLEWISRVSVAKAYSYLYFWFLAILPSVETEWIPLLIVYLLYLGWGYIEERSRREVVHQWLLFLRPLLRNSPVPSPGKTPYFTSEQLSYRWEQRNKSTTNRAICSVPAVVLASLFSIFWHAGRKPWSYFLCVYKPQCSCSLVCVEAKEK